MKRSILTLVVTSLFLGAVGNASAGLMLTSDGQSNGFGLSTFATGFAATPIGIAFTPSGGVLVGDFAGTVRVFPTAADGQSVSSVAAQNYGAGNSQSLAQVGGNIYMAQAGLSRVVQLNADGTINQTIVNIPQPPGYGNNLNGFAVNPINGHLFLSQSTTGGQPNRVYDIDPVAKTATVFLDGTTYTNQLAFNPAGTVIYAATDYAAPNSTAHVRSC